MKKIMVKQEKYLTEKKFKKFEGSFDTSMRAIAHSFAKVDENLAKHGKVLDILLKEVQAMHEDNKYFRQSVSTLYTDGSSHDRRIENLTMRVERLESTRK